MPRMAPLSLVGQCDVLDHFAQRILNLTTAYGPRSRNGSTPSGLQGGNDVDEGLRPRLYSPAAGEREASFSCQICPLAEYP